MFHVYDSLFIFQFFLTYVLFISIFDVSGTWCGVGIEDLHVKNTPAAKAGIPKSAGLDIEAGFIFSACSSVIEGLAFLCLKFGLDFDIVTNVSHYFGERVTDLIVAHVSIATFATVEWMWDSKIFATGAFWGKIFWLKTVPEIGRREIRFVKYVKSKP